MKVGFISLGCSKNLVDTEMMIGLFRDKNYEIVSDPKIAEVIVINTCGFIESAKQEAINTILEMAQYKNPKIGNCKKLIVTGCLVQRYKEDLEKTMPEVDMFLRYSDYAEEKGNSDKAFADVFSELEGTRKENEEKLQFTNRIITTGDCYAYIRIAEGCDNRCTYCAIPSIRGNFVSRKIEDIIEEAEKIAESGRQEIILIAQDTSKYGQDIYGEPSLDKLLKELCKIDGIKWIRFLYAYPETITDELIKVVKENEKICKYFDIPIQHISNKILKRMNRHTTSEDIKKVIAKLRKEIPEVIIRTTVMVGFPGETKEDFDELYEFVKEEKFDRLGAFMYSKEENTPAATMGAQIHFMTKKSRYNKIMNLQQQISKEQEKENLDREIKVLIENISEDRKYLIGRSYMEVPDIDGLVYVENNENAELNKAKGKYINCKVVDTKEYDLICKKI